MKLKCDNWIKLGDGFPTPNMTCILWTRNNMIYLGSLMPLKKGWNIETLYGMQSNDLDWVVYWQSLPNPPLELLEPK